MEFVNIKDSEINVSRIALGTWAIGGWMWGGTDEKKSIETILGAFEKGINMLDTAPIYGFGVSEQIVGKAVKEYGKRENVIIATKTGLEWENSEVTRNSSRGHILKEVEDSLRRLQTDYIDIYQIHWPDKSVPFEETAETMKGLLKEGKIRAIGVSNFSPAQMDTFRQVVEINTAQPPYNLFEREVEKDVLPYCIKEGINILAYGSLCRGLLSGKMTSDREFHGDDLRKYDPKFQKGHFMQYLKVIEKLDLFAEENFGKKVIHLAVRWILDKTKSGVALWGARKPEQLVALEDALGWSLNKSDMDAIDSIIENYIDQSIGPEFMAPPEEV